MDISARKQADARFRAAVESSPNGMIMSDRSGRIIMVNRETERLFGYTRAELLELTIEDLVPTRFRSSHPANRAMFRLNLEARAMGHGRDLFGLRKDGSEIPVEIGLTPIETDDEVLILNSIVDISPRKDAELALRQSEERLRQSQKLEAVGTLAGGIAHDFNNLLSAIIGFGEIVQEAVKGNPELKANMDELLTAAGRGKQLVKRIMTFSRRQELERRPVLLSAVTEESIHLLRSTLPATIEISRSLDHTAGRVLADTTAIQQIVMNLATNAAQAMPHGGQLRIGITQRYVQDHEVRINSDLHEGYYNVLTVQDSGGGMDADTMKRAFEPFFTTKPPGSGTGLGLAMVRAMIREHEGAVALDSEPGRGTVVRCYFPTIDTVAQERPAELSDLPSGSGERLLYLDDEPSLARLGAKRLESLQYRVFPFTVPGQALTRFRAAPQDFDLVITDFTMPKMTGLDFAREIHALRPDIPIIMLSGYVEEIPDSAIREAGIGQILMKPATLEDLARAIRAALPPRGPAQDIS